jgi:hypothetical protein
VPFVPPLDLSPAPVAANPMPSVPFVPPLDLSPAPVAAKPMPSVPFVPPLDLSPAPVAAKPMPSVPTLNTSPAPVAAKPIPSVSPVPTVGAIPAPVAAKAIPPAKPAPMLKQSVASPPRKLAAKAAALQAKAFGSGLTSLQHVATAVVPPAREVKKLSNPLPDLESTQTVRALTPPELENEDTSRWFVIQLSLSDQAFDPDTVPNLDIFSEYRLYSVASVDQGRTLHALRLGFFTEEIAAVMVASYLGAYYDKPTIRRVSVAERERFNDQRVEARKDVGATGRHAVIEITSDLVARRKRTTSTSTTDTSSASTGQHALYTPR